MPMEQRTLEWTYHIPRDKKWNMQQEISRIDLVRWFFACQATCELNRRHWQKFLLDFRIWGQQKTLWIVLEDC